MNAEAEVWEIEREFWEADAAFHDAHCAHDVLLLLDGEIQDRDRAIGEVADVPRLTSLVTTQESTRRLGADVVALAYSAVSCREGQADPYVVVVGSVYARRDGSWQLVSHQHTPASADRAPGQLP